MKRTILCAALTFLCLGGSLAAQPIPLSLDTQTGASQFVPLGAGCWRVQVTGGAWNAWGVTTGCGSNGDGCSRGWGTWFDFSSTDLPSTTATSGRWSTPSQALANAPDTFLGLPSAQVVRFWIRDPVYSDNIGGPLSLLLTRIEPFQVSDSIGPPSGCRGTLDVDVTPANPSADCRSWDLRFDVAGAAPGSTAWFLGSLAESTTSLPFLPCSPLLHIDRSTLFVLGAVGPIQATGSGSWTLPALTPPEDVTFFAQALALGSTGADASASLRIVYRRP